MKRTTGLGVLSRDRRLDPFGQICSWITFLSMPCFQGVHYQQVRLRRGVVKVDGFGGKKSPFFSLFLKNPLAFPLFFPHFTAEVASALEQTAANRGTGVIAAAAGRVENPFFERTAPWPRRTQETRVSR
ncbi:MAG TPA: hypothetical protein VNT79_13490 [Phycisphaerae bacterium]|nr:hypothetical protein [Phycisphaerae bacterium]